MNMMRQDVAVAERRVVRCIPLAFAHCTENVKERIESSISMKFVFLHFRTASSFRILNNHGQKLSFSYPEVS